MTSPVLVQITDSTRARGLAPLVPILESLFPICIRQESGDSTPPAARIVSGWCARNPGARSERLPTLELPPAHSSRAEIVTTEIRFASGQCAPWPFRGRTLSVRTRLDAGMQASYSDGEGVEVIAADRDGRPVWTVDRRGPAPIHWTALQPPSLAEGVDVGLATSGDRFIQILPLFEFLKEATLGRHSVNPVLRAGFIIDDPNLHWPRYGYANYREIAASARRDHFHVAFATIPLDAWLAHPPTVDIFKRHASELSLLIHGNNHAREELAQPRAREECASLLRQAVARTRKLESKTGLQISRVMVPPHGACSAQMLGEMPKHGFEAACISAGSLRFHNPHEPWSKHLGLAPSETVHGCAVMPRWAFAGMSQASLLSAAYLGQPLILRGHHGDLKNGLDLLRDFAGSINSLGDVMWGSMSTLSRLNYRHRVEGATLLVEPLGGHVVLTAPATVQRLVVAADGFDYDLVESGMNESTAARPSGVAVVPGRRYSLLRRITSNTCPDAKPFAAPSPALLLRRLLTETRDRLRIA